MPAILHSYSNPSVYSTLPKQCKQTYIHKKRISILNHVTMCCCRNMHPYINNTFSFLCIRPSMAGRILLAIWWQKLKLHITDLYHRRENALPIYKCTFPEQHIVRWSKSDIPCSYICPPASLV